MTDTSQPAITTVGEEVVVVSPQGPPNESLPPGEWVRKRLFPTPLNGLVTIVLGVISAYLGYRLFRFVFITGRWEPVSRNLELFMLGLFPRVEPDDERWRVVGQLLVMATGVGIGLGTLSASRFDAAEDTGEPAVRDSWRTYLSSYWSIVLFVGVLLVAFVRTPGPWLLTGGAVVLGAVGWAIGRYLPRSLRPLGWSLAALAVVISFQILSGTGGWAWLFTTLALLPFLNSLLGRIGPDVAAWLSPAAVVAAIGIALFTLVSTSTILGIVALLVAAWAALQYWQGDRIDAARVGLFVALAALVAVINQLVDHTGVDWEKWSGLHLSLVVAGCSILLAFPIGILLALGRRSTLPAIRVMSVAYIEFFRGAPLITFLLAGQFFLGFFLDSDTPLSSITRAIAAITLFSSAYVAEIVRGGLQAVPKGQTEAGQASGLSQAKITRLIVLPQALRAVIPAMVGQFISLFKDTSLLTIIGITEFLNVRDLVHAQDDFRGFGIAETLTFIAFGYWAFSFAMSRESQRLERRLGVGQR
jgi:general L-amino acid transport system permease protein